MSELRDRFVAEWRQREAERQQERQAEDEMTAALVDNIQAIGLSRPQSAVDWYLLALRVGCDPFGPRSDIAIRAIAWAEGQMEIAKLLSKPDEPPNLTPTAELVLQKMDGGEWHTSKTIAASTGIHAGNIRRALATLKQFRFVEHEPGKGYRRLTTFARAKMRAE